MREVLARHWWILVARGVVAVLFGAAAFFMTGAGSTTLEAFLGIYILIEGVTGIFFAAEGRGESASWGWYMAEGLTGAGVGLLMLARLGADPFAFITFVGVWAIATGVLEVIAAVKLSEDAVWDWLLGLSAIASLAFGGVLMIAAWPEPVARTVAVLFGVYALVFGLLNTALGFRLKTYRVPSSPA